MKGRKTFLVAAVAVLFCSAAVFAEGMPMYLKGTLGWENRWSVFDYEYEYEYTDVETTSSYPYYKEVTRTAKVNGSYGDYSGRFVLNPGIGMVFKPDSDNIFLKGLGAEASLGIGFGSISNSYIDSGVFSLVPRVNAVWHLFFGDAKFGDGKQKFVPHAVLGFEIPIQVPFDSDLSTAVSFGLDTGVGVTFNLNDKLGLVADFNWTLPFGNAYGISLTAGATYRLK